MHIERTETKVEKRQGSVGGGFLDLRLLLEREKIKTVFAVGNRQANTPLSPTFLSLDFLFRSKTHFTLSIGLILPNPVPVIQSECYIKYSENSVNKFGVAPKNPTPI